MMSFSRWLVILILGLFLASRAQLAAADASPTNTPLPDGRILYAVQDGDTPWGIAAQYGLTVDEFLSLNHLESGDILQIGQQVVVHVPALAATATPTSLALTSVPTTLMPLPTAIPGPSAVAPTVQPIVNTATGSICVLAYRDANADGRRDVGEGPLGDVQFELLHDHQVQATYQTETKAQTYCFEHLAPGQYLVRGKIPTGMRGTTPTEATVAVQAGLMAVFELGGTMPSTNVPSASASTLNLSGLPTVALIVVVLVVLGILGVGLRWIFFRAV